MSGYNKILIRYNTQSKDDETRWRLIDNGKEYLIQKVIIDNNITTSKDWMEDIEQFKWHISLKGKCRIENNIAYVTSIKEKRVLLRHILKTISYRILGTIVTIMSALCLGASIELSSIIGLLELTIKPIVYFLHERFWYLNIKIKN